MFLLDSSLCKQTYQKAEKTHHWSNIQEKVIEVGTY